MVFRNKLHIGIHRYTTNKFTSV
ncbi:hypothetical protein MED222_06485 [Vibrio sp. MED222]|nr:hypothetical protein MED222_06485 [Vibrio sp. MED222]